MGTETGNRLKISQFGTGVEAIISSSRSDALSIHWATRTNGEWNRPFSEFIYTKRPAYCLSQPPLIRVLYDDKGRKGLANSIRYEQYDLLQTVAHILIYMAFFIFVFRFFFFFHRAVILSWRGFVLFFWRCSSCVQHHDHIDKRVRSVDLRINGSDTLLS